MDTDIDGKAFFLVDLPHAYYGIEVTDGIVTRTPPIAKWMKGSTWDYARKWIIDKGGAIYEGRL